MKKRIIAIILAMALLVELCPYSFNEENGEHHCCGAETVEAAETDEAAEDSEADHDCDDKTYTPDVDGKRLTAYCANCGYVYDYYAEVDLQDNAELYLDNFKIYVTDENWTAKTGNKIKILYRKAATDTETYSLTDVAPTSAGSYTVCITRLSIWNKYVNGKYNETQLMSWCTTEIPFTLTYYYERSLGGDHSACTDPCPKACVDGNRLVVKCETCGYLYDASAYCREEEVFCSDNCDVTVYDVNWTENAGGESYVILYEGSGDTTYSLSATPPCTKGTYKASLCLSSAWQTYQKNKNINVVEQNRTWGEEFTIQEHDWRYSTSDCSLKAECSWCGEKASVTIDTSKVYDAGRTAYKTSTTGLVEGIDPESLCYDDNWCCQHDIAKYELVYYEGYEVIDDDKNVAAYENTTIVPTKEGTYTAMLRMTYTKEVDEDSWYYYDYYDEEEEEETEVTLTTEMMPFYIAISSINSAGYSTKEYGPTQIAAFTEPESKRQSEGMAYYVGTLSELLWMCYNYEYDENSRVHIYITNDIVVNPIIVTDDGQILSASSEIYKWKGLGSKDNPFQGTIFGGGHTIYGLYCPAEDSNVYAGLINYGTYMDVENLTVENSYLKNKFVGAFVGCYNAGFGECINPGVNCYSLNNYLVGSQGAGGIIGLYNGAEATYHTFTGCENTSFCKGVWTGGIIGRIDTTNKADWVFLLGCYNSGTMESTCYEAGGIIGSASARDAGKIYIEKCINKGKIISPDKEGGIVGWYNADGTGLLDIHDCLSIGYLSPEASTSVAGILGAVNNTNYYKNGNLSFANNKYYNAARAYYSGLTYSGDSPETTATNLKTPTVINSGEVCCEYGHVAQHHYTDVTSATCTEDGTATIVCDICGKVLETRTTKAHGHSYTNKVCDYCGEKETDNASTGSIFSKSGIAVICTAGGALVAAAVAVVIVKKKKKKAE